MIVFVSNYLNQHQYPLAHALYKQTHGEYWFIETEPTPEIFLNAGYSSYESLPYLLKSWQDTESKTKAHKLILEADCAIFDDISYKEILIKRLNQGKITLQCGERWLKKGFPNLLSPRLIKYQWFYHTFLYNKPIYMLCASAFAAKDLIFLHSFKDRCFKWGYFTAIDNIDIPVILEKRRREITQFITIGRLIDWKHHDITIKAAKILKDKGYKFKIDIYGSGKLKEQLANAIIDLNLTDFVELKGNLPNQELTQKIRDYNGFILASNRREGWGAVINEAMSNACPVIASDKIGAVPYLVTDAVNGLIFKSGNPESLAAKMKQLIDSQSLSEKLAAEAYRTMQEEWSPQQAANNLIKLIANLNNNGTSEIPSGPCSKA